LRICQSEIGIADVKVPILLGLTKLLWCDDATVDDIPSTSRIATWNRIFSGMDEELLGEEICELKAIHLCVDTSLLNWFVAFVSFWHKERGMPVQKLFYSGRLGAATGVNEAAAISDKLAKLGVRKGSIYSVVSDKGSDITGKHVGLVTTLGSLVGNKVNSVLCDLHAINWSLRMATKGAFGQHVKGKPHVVQLAYCIAYLMDQDWLRFKYLLGTVGNSDDTTKMDIPLSVRWYTVVNAMRYCLENTGVIIKLARYVYYHWKAGRTVTRKMWRDVDIWLHSPLIIAQMCFVVEFADFFYLPEMAWSETSKKYGVLLF